MTARKWLLKLISFIIFLFCISLAYAVTEFRLWHFNDDVIGWSVHDDCDNIALSNTQVYEGGFSGRARLFEDSAGSGEIRDWTHNWNFDGWDNFSMWVYVDHNDFAYDGLLSIELSDTDTVGCSPAISVTKSNSVDDSWNFLTVDISSLSSCNISSIRGISISAFTEDNPAFPHYVYVDKIFLWCSDSCCPPLIGGGEVAGDWIISDGDFCSLNDTTRALPLNLNISNGGLEIGQTGTLNVSGGYIYIYPGSNFTILSGGQIHGE